METDQLKHVRRKRFWIITLVVVVGIYLTTYFILAQFRARVDGENNRSVWSFTGTGVIDKNHPGGDIPYIPASSINHRLENALYVLYFPLIKSESMLTGTYHWFDRRNVYG